MNLTAYVQRQKNLIMSRRNGVPAAGKVEAFKDCDTERLLRELDSLKGLNKAERLGAVRYKELKTDFA